MASKTARPGRRLIVFALIVAALYGGVALSGEWKPKLGLDLQGGTRITLEALTTSGEKPSPTALEEARGIIDQRVNGSGVAESEVSTQGGNNIVVEVPGPPRGDLVNTVKQTAQLRFRLVAAVGSGQPQPACRRPAPHASGAPSGAASASPGGATPSTGPQSSPSASPKGRAPFGGVHADKTKPSKSPSAQTTKKPSAAPTATPQAPQTDPAGAPVDQPLKWMDNPGTTWLQKFASYKCPPKGKQAKPVFDDKTKPLVTCDEDGNKYLLSAALIEGTQLKKAEAGIPAEPGAVGGQPDLRRRRPQGVRDRHPRDRQPEQRPDRPAEAVRDRAGRQGDLGPDGERRDPERPGRDQRQLHPDRGADAGQQPEVRRAAAEVLGAGGHRGGADPRLRPALRRPGRGRDRARAGADLLPDLLPRSGTRGGGVAGDRRRW